MKICLLASGSKGNSTYLETKFHKILIDVGISCRYIENNLKEIGVDPSEIDSVFITHTHIDHVSGLKTFCKKYNPVVYLTEKMYLELRQDMNIENYVLIDGPFVLDDLNVTTIRTSHDTVDGLAYVLESEGKSIVYITDTGYINVKNHPLLKNKDLYIIESNHDVELLMKSSKPYHLKQRILSDKGHLSNKDCAYYLSTFVGDNTQCIILAHLSEENNDENIALNTVVETLNKAGAPKPNIIVARQKERTELVEI